jgi:hypothetical protein
MIQRIRLLWQSAVTLAGALTVPKSDIAASDRAVELVLRDSWLFHVVDAVGASVRNAWPHAQTRSWWLQFAADWTVWSMPERVRTVGIAVAVAGLTALVAEAVSAPMQPLAWVLPAVLTGMGLLVAIGAAPLARAIADKTS